MPSRYTKVREAIPKDYYAILGVDQAATQAEVSAAFRNLALKYPRGIDLGCHHRTLRDWLLALLAS